MSEFKDFFFVKGKHCRGGGSMFHKGSVQHWTPEVDCLAPEPVEFVDFFYME